MRRGLSRCYARGIGIRQTRPVTLTKEEQKKILEADLNEVNLEKQEIENRIKQLN